jgi:hypothetical protein
LKATPDVNMLIQVVEWYNVAAAGTNGIIDATNAAKGPAFIAKDAAAFAPTNGVFWNPATTSLSTDTLGSASLQFSTANAQDNALSSVPNSIGRALWYERDAGQAKDAV